jgi:predicted metal-dependent phosphoesterase TrpH
VLSPSTTFDLHLHTSASDGRHPADAVVARCLAAGLGAIALTDHDLPVVPATRVVADGGRSMLLVAGAELSGALDGSEQHLLVYFPGAVPSSIRDWCRAQCVARAERYETAQIGRAHV